MKFVVNAAPVLTPYRHLKFELWNGSQDLRIPEIISGCWPFWPFCLMNCRFFSIFAVAKEPG